MSRLSGTRVLVTGGTSGLGRAMAAALVEAGAEVAIAGRQRAVGGGRGAAWTRMLEPGTGRVVTISMSDSTMARRGFVPYGRIVATEFDDWNRRRATRRGN